MFVGHYAVALAATAADRKARLWMTVAGCQLIDIAWGVFVVIGVERAHLDPSLPFLPYVFDYMPWTHSLPAALIWSAAAFGVARALLRIPRRAASLVALTVFSHWPLDVLVHHADLALWIGGPKIGLGFWNYPGPAQALEIGLLAVGGGIAIASRKADGRSATPVIAFVALLVALQIAAILMPKSPSAVAMGGLPALTFVALAAVAAFVDRSAPGNVDRTHPQGDRVPA